MTAFKAAIACRHCKFEITMAAENPLDALAAFEEQHRALRPDCPTSKARHPQSAPAEPPAFRIWDIASDRCGDKS